jgi:hypothetical protein
MCLPYLSPYPNAMANAVASSAITVFNAVPFTVIASASRVPSKSPSTASMLPLKIVAVTVPVLGL